MSIEEESCTISGRSLILSVGKYAPQAETSVFARMGDTCVLVTVGLGSERTDIDYFPLSVEYVEKLYAGGVIKGSRWVKREGAPSDEAILVSRLIDRGVRPLFPKGLRRDVQVIITLLSIDGINAPDMLAAVATSAALTLSRIPWNGPVATTRVGYRRQENNEGGFILHPTESEIKESDLDLVVTSSEKRVLMIEAKGHEIPEDSMVEGILLAHKENNTIITCIQKLQKKLNRKKDGYVDTSLDKELVSTIKKSYAKQVGVLLEKIASSEGSVKEQTKELVDEIYTMNNSEYDKTHITTALEYLFKTSVRALITTKKKRIDGRSLDDIRAIAIETSLLPRTHGSALFQRGQTQVLSIATLGSLRLEQYIEGPEGKEIKRYLHHYYMPPYATGEVGRLMNPSRREKGHGALAEKALEVVLPKIEDFPYMIRVVSEVMSSNGSTSMAATCGSTLALMDAGVPIKKAVAGISVGLVEEGESWDLLTDIMGLEDFYGDMDFKVAGTDEGICAIQLDVKNTGLTQEMIQGALQKAKKARTILLEKMKAIIASPRKELSEYAPKIVVLIPPEDKIGEIIGPGGKTIRNIIAKTGAEIDVMDDGKVNISALSKESIDEAVAIIENIYREIRVGEEFEGEVKRIMAFGAFVEILPNKEGMVHVSQMGKGYVKSAESVVSLGDKVKVKVIKVDERGRIDLTLVQKL